MAHNLMNETMLYVGKTPWHGLGKALEIPPSTEDALRLSGLDWYVHKEELLLSKDELMDTTIGSGYYATWRYDSDMNKVILGSVSERYEVVQNKEAFQPFDEVLLNYDYTYETAGALGSGERIWILAKSPNKYQVGNDEMNEYVLLYNSHDGSSGIVMRPTLVRVVCQNTLDLSLNISSKHSHTIKHTKNARQRLDDLTQSLENAQGNVRLAIETMNYMQEYVISESELDAYFEQIFPTLKHRERVFINPQTGKKAPNYAKPHYEALVNNYRYGKGNKGKTMWDAYNAVTEYVDHNKNYTDPLKSIGFNWGYKTKKQAFAVASNIVSN